MSSKIEQQIDQIEDYIDACKFQAFSNTKIIVDKEEFDGLLQQLRAKTPDEIRHYQKIISNRDAILEDAKKRADALINEATVQTNQLINEHEIMQQAYAQANEVVKLASKQAQEILDKAINEANSYRESAAEYMDDMLAQMEVITTQTMESTEAIHKNLQNQLGGYVNTINQNRAELHPREELTSEPASSTTDFNTQILESGVGAEDAVSSIGDMTADMFR